MILKMNAKKGNEFKNSIYLLFTIHNFYAAVLFVLIDLLFYGYCRTSLILDKIALNNKDFNKMFNSELFFLFKSDCNVGSPWHINRFYSVLQ